MIKLQSMTGMYNKICTDHKYLAILALSCAGNGGYSEPLTPEQQHQVYFMTVSSFGHLSYQQCLQSIAACTLYPLCIKLSHLECCDY